MNKAELVEDLQRQGVKPRAYDFKGTLKDEVYCLDEAAGMWTVYYRERGLRRDERRFTTEHDACSYFRDLILSDPTTKR